MEGSGLALPDNILEVVNTPGEGKSKWIDENEDLSLTTGHTKILNLCNEET